MSVSRSHFLDQLKVVHLKKDAGFVAPERLPQPIEGELLLDSCQRMLLVSTSFNSEVLSSALLSFESGTPTEVHLGMEAYELLLRVATGLESKVVGETDILGQLKEAWKKAPESSAIDSLMQRLLEDTKFVRSRYMEGLGGSSYGSLVRMLLGTEARAIPTVVLGAGQLAQVVAPYFVDNELVIINRTAEKALDLVVDLRKKGAERCSFNEQNQELEVLSRAEGVLVCLPPDEVRDVARVAALRKNDAWVVHLGLRRGQEGAWKAHSRLFTLDDLFDLEKNQDEARKLQVSRALHACADRAKLRSMGNSISIAHGWEDLAVFA